MASTINASTSPAAIVQTADGTGILALQTGNTTAVTIDASQNVGIGTTSPVGTAGVKLDVRGSITGGAAGNGRASLEQGTATNSGYLAVWNTDISTRLGYVGYATLAGSGTFNVMSDNSTNALAFGTNATERMRIDSSGHVYVGTTTFVPGEGNTATGVMIANTGKGFFSNGSDSAINANRNNDGGLIICRRSGNSVGSISVTSSATAYNTSSDYRLKENIAPMIGALDTVAQLKPVTYKWKIDGSDGQGFIAHELQEVVPDCVTGEKDAVDEEGNPVHQGVDTSFLVATLTAAIQEQQTLIVSQSDLINSLTARVTALEAK
jgi:hypothetical protein